MREERRRSDHVSIVMPAYNAEKYLDEAIRSIMNQTYQYWDLIIVDDGSSDDTYRIATNFACEDKRVGVYQNKDNKGVAFSRERGIGLARGPWIAFLDSDDMWKREKLANQLELAHTLDDASFIFTGTEYIDGDGNASSYVLSPPKTVCFDELLACNPITCSSVLIRKDKLVIDAAMHDGLHEDYAMWLSILKNESCAYAVPKPLTMHRMTSGSKSSNKIRAARMNYRTLSFVGVNPFIAVLKMMQYAVKNFRKYSAIYKGFA